MKLKYGGTRPGWEATVMTEGLGYVDTLKDDGTRIYYWREAELIELTKQEMELFTYAVRTLYNMMVGAGQYVIDNNLFHRLHIPEFAIPAIKMLWKDVDDPEDPLPVGYYFPMLYGRFDLCPVLNDEGTIIGFRMYEYNADTPTGMVETAVTQWNWFMDLHKRPDTGQYNELYESLVQGIMYDVRRTRQLTGRPVDLFHFAYSDKDTSGEDELNTSFMEEAARQASQELIAAGEPGFDTVRLFMSEIVRTGEEITYKDEYGELVTEWVGEHYFSYDGKPVEVCWKLFPWEWMMQGEFAKVTCDNMMLKNGTIWIEPIWKMLWSNKGILAILWEMYKNDPEKRELLIPTWFEGEQPANMDTYVRKTLRGREGANVKIVVEGTVVESGPENYERDDDADGPAVIQAYSPPPVLHEVLSGTALRITMGAWTVHDQPVAILMRGSDGDVATNTSYAIGHVGTGFTYEDFN